METSLRYDSKTKKFQLYAKENFVSDDNVVLTVSGALATDDGSVNSRIALYKKYFPEVNTRIDVGLKYGTQQRELSYGIQAKKSLELSEDGLLSLDMKMGYHFVPKRKQKRMSPHDMTGKLEISQKIFNFTEDQDLRVKIGYGMFDRSLHGQIRENNWTLNTDFRGAWSIAYDL